MQDDETYTINESLSQAVVGEERENGWLQEGRIDRGSVQLGEQRQDPEKRFAETGNFECGEEEESHQSDSLDVDSRDGRLHEEIRPAAHTQRKCQGEEKTYGQERTDAQWENERSQQTIHERQEDEVELEPNLKNEPNSKNEGMPFLVEDAVVATFGSPGHDDAHCWSQCLSKKSLTKLLGKYCLPKQLSHELEEERKILERMEKIESSVSKISQRIDRLSRNGYVCKRHASKSYRMSNSDMNGVRSTGGSEYYSSDDDIGNSPPSSECPSGPNCIGRMVSFNSSLARSIDSTYYEGSENLNNCESSSEIYCSSSFCQGMIKGGSCDKRTTNAISSRLNSCVDEKLSGIGEYSICDDKMYCPAGNKTPGSNKKSSISFKELPADKQECSFLGKELLSGCKGSTSSCKNPAICKKEVSPYKVNIQTDKETPYCSKASTASKINKDPSSCNNALANKGDSCYSKELSSRKASLVSNKCSSANNAVLTSKSKSSNFCNESLMSQKEFNLSENESCECDELTDAANTDQSCEESSLKEPSAESQPTTLNCEIESQKELETIVEEKRRLPYSDDYEPYLIKKPDAMPRSMQRKLARMEAEQRQSL